MNDDVEGIEQDRVRLRTMVLQHVKRDTPVLIKGDDLAAKESVWRQVLAGFGDSEGLVNEPLPRLDQSVTPVESLPKRHL